MQKLLISELLSSVSQSISEAEMKMFCLSEQSKSKFLPAISRILSQLQCLVSNNFLKMEVDVSSQSLSWDSDHDYPEYCEETTSISGDEERDVMSSTPDEERNVMKSIRKDEEDKFTASIKKAEDDKFITSMIMFIRTSSPNLVFSRSKSNKRRKRRLKKIVHSELLDVWSNFSEFVSPPKMSTPASSCSYPTVDWTKVNKRFLSNIPVPSLQPLHGCSPDPIFYEDRFERSDYGYHRNMGSQFSNPNPFGAALGYLTDAGAIGVPDCVYHGHVYDATNQGWILHACYPENQEKVPKRKRDRMNMKKRKQRG